MGLFDFFKPKKKEVAPLSLRPENRPDGDIYKTAIIADLFKTPRQKRDDQWFSLFYENVAGASFASAKQQLLTGPDGFTYFILKTPEPNSFFESFCLQHMMEDFLLKEGWGVVFNPAEDKSADWVFTHGQIVNLHLHNQFTASIDESAVSDIEFTKNVGVLTKEERVMIAQPSETYLPMATRKALKSFLQTRGIKRPKVMMLTSETDGKMVRKLAFNIHPENYPVTSKLDYLMQQVGWFLPPDYLLIPLQKNSPLATGLQAM